MTQKIAELRTIHRSLVDADSVQPALDALVRMGYRPGIYSRGNLWRAHTNVGKNCWHDGRTIRTAIRGAIESEILFIRNYGAEGW